MKRLIRELGLGQLSWYNPLVISSIIALVLVLLAPLDLRMYKSSPGIMSEGSVRWFDDLEGDGAAEYLIQKTNTTGNIGVMYYDDAGMLMGQENFDAGPSENIYPFKPAAVDLNRDGTKEVILFSTIGDSIFLNVFDYAAGRAVLNHRFITTVGGFNNKKDYSIWYYGASDVTGDRVPELFFYVVGQFSLYPRRLFRYDFARDSLTASLNTGAGFHRGMFHSRGDSTMIVIPAAGFQNVPTEYPYPYHDSCSWIFAFNAQLELMWDPMPLVSPVSQISDVLPHDSGFIFMHRNIRKGAVSSIIYSITMNGEIRARREFEMLNIWKIVRFDVQGKPHFIMYGMEMMDKPENSSMELDPESLDLRKTGWSKLIADKFFLQQYDINYDGEKEVILHDRKTQQIEIYDVQRRLVCAIPFSESYIQYLTAGYDRDRGQGELLIMSEAESFSIYISRNRWFAFRYLIWLGYFVFSFVFVSGIFLIQIRRNRRMNMMEKQISRMYLTNLKNQLDPHFTLNALNTVGSYIYKEERDKAYDMFQRFSALIRSALITSDQTIWSLTDELQFVENYLELQYRRFPDKFTYEIAVDTGKDPSEIRIPRLIVQMCVENSIKHAFEGIDYMGRIVIRVNRQGLGHVLSISDNGLGMDESRRRGGTRGTLKGLGLIADQVRLTNQLYQTDFRVEIGGEGADESGMKVRVWLP